MAAFLSPLRPCGLRKDPTPCLNQLHCFLLLLVQTSTETRHKFLFGLWLGLHFQSISSYIWDPQVGFGILPFYPSVWANPPHLWTSRKDAHLTWLYLSNMQIKPNSVMFINFRLSSSNNDIWPLSRRPRVKTDFSSLHCSPTWCTDCSLSLVPILILFRGYIEYKFVCVIFLSLISQKIFQKFQATRLPLIHANCSLCQIWMQDIYFHLLAISRCVNFFWKFCRDSDLINT